MLQHRAGSQRMARGGLGSRPDAWAHPGHGRAPAVNVQRSRLARRCPRSGVGVGRITQDRKMQREGLRKGDGSE